MNSLRSSCAPARPASSNAPLARASRCISAVVAGCLLMHAPVWASLSFNQPGDVVAIDFNDYAGAGLLPGGGGGALDSDAFRASFSSYHTDLVEGTSLGDYYAAVEYGDTSADAPFAGGVSADLPAQPGLFAVDLGEGDRALGALLDPLAPMTQPEGVWSSAYVAVRAFNNGAAPIMGLLVEYDLYVLNVAETEYDGIYADGEISSSSGAYIDPDDLLADTPAEADPSPSWTVESKQQLVLLPVSGWDGGEIAPIAPGDFVEIGLSLGGSFSTAGTIDAVAWDNLRITAVEPEPYVPGDFDQNGAIDGFDLLMWQRGESPEPLGAADFVDWEANFGGTLGVAAGVPEPGAMCLALLAAAGGAGAVRLRRCRRSA